MIDSRLMNIVYVIDYLASVNGGTERQLHRLIQGMIEKGHNIRLFVFRHTDYTRNLESFDCPVECLNIGAMASPSSLKRLISFRRKLKTEDVDIVHGFFNDVATFFPVLFLGSGCRVFTSRRDMGIWYTKPKLALLRLFLWSPVHIICNCRAVAELTHKKEWKPWTRISIIYNGIDRFDDNHSLNNNEVFDKINKDSDAVKIVMVANVRPIKRIEDLILAASEIERKNLHYFIVGKIWNQAYYLKLCDYSQKNKLNNNIHFLGRISEPRSILNQFDIGVLCSESEGLSNTIMEYLDAGLATIASNVGGNPELVEDGVSGFLYDVGDHRKLARIIGEIADNPEHRLSVGKKAEESLSRFSVSNMIDKHLALYND